MIRFDRYFAIGLISVTGLVLIYLFQRIDIAFYFGVTNTSSKFFINRSIRFVMNDALSILLIYTIFKKRKYILFSIWVQLFGLVFILMPYFAIKYFYPAYNGPLVSFLHRLVLNPTLMLLLIPAFYLQEMRHKNGS